MFGFAADHAAGDLAVIGHDDVRLERAGECSAGKEERLGQIAVAADLADPRQIGPDVAADARVA